MALGNLGETLARAGETRIHLCGSLTARIEGSRVEADLPGRQGRSLFAYLVVHRMRPTPRAELLQVLWPDTAPAAADSALAALLAKLRRALGTSMLSGRHDLRLVLPRDAWVDVEAAVDGLHRAESAISAGDWPQAWGPARVASHIAERGFMPGYEGPWITATRRRLEDLLVRAYECAAECALRIGGAEIPTAERAARRLTEVAPFRESGYRLLMQTLAVRDNVGEALIVYERLRTALRDELGVSPSPATQSLHLRLLTGERVDGRGPA